MPNITDQNGTRPMTPEEESAYNAAQAASAPARAAQALHDQANATLAGYTLSGVNFPLSPERIAYYEGVNRNAQAGVLDGQYPIQLIGTDGIVEAADADAVAAAYADMQATFMATTLQLGAQLKALEA